MRTNDKSTGTRSWFNIGTFIAMILGALIGGFVGSMSGSWWGNAGMVIGVALAGVAGWVLAVQDNYNNKISNR
ncbi:MAG: hypothetical protein QM758_01315 [Armatimonas sp.]